MKTRSALPAASGILAAKSFTLLTAASVTERTNGSSWGVAISEAADAFEDMTTSGADTARRAPMVSRNAVFCGNLAFDANPYKLGCRQSQAQNIAVFALKFPPSGPTLVFTEHPRDRRPRPACELRRKGRTLGK